MQKFERIYFQSVYRNDYEKRNPPYKNHAYLSKIIQYKTNGRLLDIGCAYGSFLQLAQKHFQCIGIDVSSHALSVARKILPKSVGLYRMSVDQIAFDKQFDVVTCFDVLEHLERPEVALKKIHSVLSKFGTLVVVVPVYDGIIGKFVDRMDNDPTHVQKKERKFWIRLLRDQGYTILIYQGIFRYFLFRAIYLHWISRFFRDIAPAIYILARKKY